jgi:hypothetical protein
MELEPILIRAKAILLTSKGKVISATFQSLLGRSRSQECDQQGSRAGRSRILNREILEKHERGGETE